MTSKKHYVAVAKAIKARLESKEGKDYGLYNFAVRDVAFDLAKLFAADNPNFDRARFLTACGHQVRNPPHPTTIPPEGTPMTRVIVIPPDGQATLAEIDGHDLRAWQTLVGGYIEHLTLTPEVSAFINEDGKALGLPFNDMGDRIVKALLVTNGHTLLPGDFIVGPVVLCGPADSAGYETDVPDKLVPWLTTNLGIGVE